MHKLEVKSTAILIDEMITAEFKIIAGNKEAIQRGHDLATVIMGRIGDRAFDREFSAKLWNLVAQLRVILKLCWDAQEIFKDYKGLTELQINSGNYDVYKLAWAGLEAQRTNALRNKLVRQIDQLLNEETVLEKTYG